MNCNSSSGDLIIGREFRVISRSRHDETHFVTRERQWYNVFFWDAFSLSYNIFFKAFYYLCGTWFFFVNLFYNNTFVTINSLFVNKERFTLVEYSFLISRFTNSEFNRWNFEGKYCDGSRIFMEYSENNMWNMN